MAGALHIGRVGLDLDLDHPAKWTDSRGLEEREMVVSGFLKSTSVENTKVLRSELLEMQGQVIAVTYSNDSHFDGFYVLGDVRIGTTLTSYAYRGLFPYEIGLFRIGSKSRVELQSNVTGTVLTNTVGLLSSEVTPFIAPPIGHLAFRWEAGSVTSFTRETEDGTMTIYTSAGDFSKDASWGADPATYYSGACELYVGATLRLRSGLDVPHDPGNWQISNGSIRLQPETGNTGRIEMEVYQDAGWESLKDMAFSDDGTKVSGWDYFTVTRNDPEAVIIRLVTGTSPVREVLDLQIRRGAPFAIGTYTVSGATSTLKVVRDTTEAATAVTPTGATGNVGVRATADDGGGNRFLIYTNQAHTNDLTEGGVSVTTTNQMTFMIGFEIDGSTAAARDDADDIALQYFGYFGERVRAVWR